MKGAGGTQGGVGPFFVGLAMAGGGGYLLTQRVTVTSGFWSFFGGTRSAFRSCRWSWARACSSTTGRAGSAGSSPRAGP